MASLAALSANAATTVLALAAATMASFVALSALQAAASVLGVSVEAESYYAGVENRLPGGGGMELVCRALGGDNYTGWSVVPRGRVPRGVVRAVELIAARGGYAWVSCTWAYRGNYLGALPLLDSRWPEAGRCQDPADAGVCRVVFEDERVRLETPGGGVRVIGDLPVKRCRKHWLLFSTGCSYPDHAHPYAGRVLANALEYFGF